MVFRTDLFRRYPRTLVYVTPAAKDGAGKPDWMADAPLATKTDPVFTGEIDEDLVFFGFPMPPEELADKWVVVEEAPPGYRFRVADLLEDIPDPPAPKPPLPRPLDGGISAQHAFALPTRVLFRGDQFLAP